MKFIANQNVANHFTEIKKLFSDSDEIYIATAFLKQSGLNKILPLIKEHIKRQGKIKIIAGQNYALTQPEALLTLRNLFKDNPEAKIYLANAKSGNKVFHPKLFIFKNGKGCSIIAGSANFTEGGLVNNIECSIQINCKQSEQVCKDSTAFFKELILPENSKEANLLTIKQYETYYKQQKENNRKVKPAPTQKKKELDYNYENLLKHFGKYDRIKREKDFKGRLYNRKQAEIILNKIADDKNLTKTKFSELLDTLVGSKEVWALWHSGSLYRNRKFVIPYYKEFQNLVKYIRNNRDKAPSIIFQKAKEMVKPIEGASINYMTEIMMTYNHKSFANLNNNPITVLRKEGGVSIKASSISFNGEDYEVYCELVKELSSKLGLRNMLEADSFFNDVYWKIKNKE